MLENGSAYAEAAHPEPHALLLEIEARTHAAAIELVPRSVGRLLSTLVTAMQANRILEIGTAYGYATLWMALAQPPAGRIWTFDRKIDRMEIAQEYFLRAGLSERIESFNQPALDVLHIFPQRNMDIVFVDAPRADYPLYLEQCLHLLKLSGLLIFNNLLEETGDEFDRAFLTHPSLDATIVPLGSGLGIGARKR